MFFSIKKRFIFAYSVFVLFALIILLFNYAQYKENAQNLKSLQKTFFPLNNQINTYSHYLHLHESFSLETLINNFERKNFLHSLTAINPKLFSKNTTDAFEQASLLLAAQEKNPTVTWLRIKKMFLVLQKKHDSYQQYIYKLANHIQIASAQDSPEIINAIEKEHREQSQKLNTQKTEIINRINALSKMINKHIENTINQDISNQKHLFMIMASIAILMILLSIIALQMGLHALKPLEKIKQASEDIRKGDFALRLPEGGPIEVKSLTHSFNAMAKSLQERNEKIEQQHLQILHSQKLATIGEMASKINHEIRNPLNAIQLNLELLLEDNLNASAQKNILAISTQIERLFSITETYLQAAKKSNKQPYHLIHIETFLNDLNQFFRPSFAAKQVEFLTENQAPFEGFLFDESLLFQSLLNIMKNALDACSEHGQIGIVVHGSKDKVLFKVWNNGEAIAPHIQEKMFDAFYTHKKSGSGLGLSITKDLLSTHNANIYLESSMPEKTTFVIEIPYVA